tara:strand:+ start:268 stop:957 length:690 start_codon:yes stop_codon:yes gene_type:complete
MKILIPPSEGKSKENTKSLLFGESKHEYSSEIKEIVNILSTSKNEDLSKIYGTSIEKSEALHKENLELFNQKCSFAYERYTGVVYNNFDFKTLDEESKEFAINNILITSGFLGLVKLNDLIPNYKLKMNVLKLTNFWKPIFSKKLENESLLIDLLPEIHSKSYESLNTVKIDFKFQKNNKFISAGHNGKAIKGKFLRYIVKNKLEKIENILEFNQDGFKWGGDFFLKKV